MGSFLIWVIILIFIVAKAVSKSKQEAKRGQNPGTTYREPQPQYGQQQTTSRPQQYGQQQTTSRPQQFGQSMPNRQAHQYVNPYQENNQEELKAKLQQRYQSQADTRTTNTIEESRKAKENEKKANAAQGDILSRANKNVQGYQEDMLHEEQCGDNLDDAQMHKEKLHNSQESYSQNHKVDFTEYDQESILGDLNDLLVKGYSGSLDFDRDFVGEGMDMLNSFTIPDELPKEMNLQQHS